MQFSYKAKNNKGEITEGALEAPSEKEATKMLGERSLFVLELTNSEKTSLKSLSFKKKVSLKDKIIFT
jgi:type II secretory pathway component PulF